ncbi:MAG: amino acid permease [Thermoleophilaceae bacterium]|nr:amino acid permease [Thermoleophilaceae bacterium]
MSSVEDPGRGRVRSSLRRGSGEAEARIARSLGEPALFAVGLSAAGSSIYFALGVVADGALGLTPLAFLVAGVFFVVTMLTYVEGNSLYPERGGASMFARYAFNELWSFVAGWAILLDYLIVMAIGAFAVSHYLAAFWGGAGDAGVEILIAGATIAYVAWANIRGITAERFRFLLRLSIASVVLFAAIIVVGTVQLFDLSLLSDSIELGETPEWDDVIFASVIAAVALTGIEAASGLAGDLRVGRRGLRRVVRVAAAGVLVLFVGISAVALMAVPVVDGSTELGGSLIEAPVLGVVSEFEPAWLAEGFRYAVGGLGALVLVQAVNGQMLGLGRLAYSLGTNRQIPNALSRLDDDRSTPYVAITTAALLAFALTTTADVEFLAGIFAFGAMLAFTLANLSVIVLRFREPERSLAYKMPLNIRVGRGSLPLPAALGVALGVTAWLSVVVLHEGARLAGGAWMLAGIAMYVIYRRGQGKSLTARYTIPAEALKEARDTEYGSILVPVSGDPLDDDIVGTAGRLAAEEAREGEGGTVLEVVFVFEVPLSLPLDARVPPEKVAKARQTLTRAKDVGEEYEGVEVATAMVRGRTTGAAIVTEAKRRGVEAIVLAAEEPSRIRGGAILGGLARGRDRFAGETTRYVVEKAPCKVILTAAPAEASANRGNDLPSGVS